MRDIWMPIGLGGNGIWGGKEDSPTPPTPPTPTDPVQLVKSCAFTHGYSRYYTISGEGVDVSFEYDTEFMLRHVYLDNENGGVASMKQSINVTKDHKYIVAVEVYDSGDSEEAYTCIDGIASTKTKFKSDDLTTFFFTAGESGAVDFYIARQDEGDNVSISITSAQVFDLTAQFGAGFEPATADAFLEAMHVESFYNLPFYEPLEDTPIVNIVSNPLFANGLTGWGLSKCTATATAGGAPIVQTATERFGGINQELSLTKTHKYMLCVNAQGEGDTYKTAIAGATDVILSTKANEDTILLFTFNDDGSSQFLYPLRDYRTKSWTARNINLACIFDMTAMFGAGNEPNREDDFFEYLGATKLSDIEIPQPLTITAPSTEETNNE